MIEILLLLGLIIINGFFSMAEAALASSRKTKLEAQAEKGNKKAKNILKLLNDPELFLETVQAGITFITILIGIYTSENIKVYIARMLNANGSLNVIVINTLANIFAVAVITYFTLLLGVFVPKRIGANKPEKVIKIIWPVMRILLFIAKPFIWILNRSTLFVARILRVPVNDQQVTEEEIKAIINEGTEQGTIEEAEQEIIERVFLLGDRSINSLMTHRSDIIWFDCNDTRDDISQKISKELHSVYPVCEGSIDNIKGILSIKDLYVHQDFESITTIMLPAIFVPENNSAYKVLEHFKVTKNRCCFIVDEYGNLQGMITLNDILEAIVGDMPQVHDTEDYTITRREDGSFLVDGQIPFYEFLEYFGKSNWINEGEQLEFSTLAGFILHKLERIPQAGELVDWDGFQFEIVDMDALRIDKIIVTVIDEDDEEG